MDFGENLKRAREEKGLTQQHLADELYVTRQAVSKWEHGTRYPDLLTTKCIANILGVSIDSLVSNDEMKQFSEKQGIVQEQKSERIITALYAIVTSLLIVKLVQSIFSLSIYLSSKTMEFNMQVAIMLVAPIVLCVIIGVLSFVAFYKSVKSEVTPKVAGAIGMIFYGYTALKAISVMAYHKPIWQNIVVVLLSIAYIVVIREYFFVGRSKLSKVIYVASALTLAYFVAFPIYEVIALTSYYKYSGADEITNLTYVVDAFVSCSFVAILLYQTIALERKRKLNNKLG